MLSGRIDGRLETMEAQLDGIEARLDRIEVVPQRWLIVGCVLVLVLICATLSGPVLNAALFPR